jgi:hypothetical protein
MQQGLKSQADLIQHQVEIQTKAMQGLKSKVEIHADLIEYQVEIQAAVIEELKSQVVGIQTKARAT